MAFRTPTDWHENKFGHVLTCLSVQGRPLADNVDVGVLARSTPGLSGAELSNMVNEAALAAARTGVMQLDRGLLDAALDKVSMGAERR